MKFDKIKAIVSKKDPRNKLNHELNSKNEIKNDRVKYCKKKIIKSL
jgi:hypothetical protein